MIFKSLRKCYQKALLNACFFEGKLGDWVHSMRGNPKDLHPGRYNKLISIGFLFKVGKNDYLKKVEPKAK